MPRRIGGYQLTTWIEPEDQADRLRQDLGGDNVRMRPAPRLEDLDRGEDGEEDDEF